jgi:hypothetical protein
MIQPGIMAAQTVAAANPVTRQYYYGQSLGESSTDDEVNWTNRLTLAFTPDADATYVVVATFDVGEAAIGCQVQVTQDGAAINTASYGTGGWLAQMAMHFIEAGPAPAAIELGVDFRVRPNVIVNGEARIRNVRLVVLRLEAEDAWVENTGTEVDNTGSFADAVDLAFTPATAGSYLFLANGFLLANSGNNTWGPQIRLYDGSVGTRAFTIYLTGQHQAGAALLWRKTGLSGPQSMRFQYLTTNPGSFAGVLGARILALRLDGFTRSVFAAQTADDLALETDYADALTLSRSLAGGDYLELAAWGTGGPVTQSEYTRFSDPSAAINESVLGGPWGSLGCSATIAELAAGQRAWSIQRKGTNAVTLLEDSALAVLQLTA